MGNRSLYAIVLAAGKGTRMKSGLPKVLHPLLGKPLVGHVIDLLNEVNISSIYLVLGHGADKVKKELCYDNLTFVLQAEQLGTAHAVLCCKRYIDGVDGDCLIMCGDTPLFTKNTISLFIKEHFRNNSDLSILSSFLSDPTGYGRILRDKDRKLIGIKEEKDASDVEKKINEINTGCYIVNLRYLFNLLDEIDCNNAQGEYYLTDIVAKALKKNLKVKAFPLADEVEAIGVNSRKQLAFAESVLLERLRNIFMDRGVTFSIPSTTYLEPTVTIGQDVFIGPQCILKGNTVIRDRATIMGLCYIEDAVINEGEIVRPGTVKINLSKERRSG